MFQRYRPGNLSRKKKILDQIGSLMPRDDAVTIIDQTFSDTSRGRKRTPAIILFKMMVLQYIFGLSDESVQEDVEDRKSFYDFIGANLLQKWGVPDATTLCKFRKHIQEHDIHDKLFDLILEKLQEKGAFLKRGTVVDSTIVKAASSTKNQSRKRDPEMASTKKGANYQFGMKVHQGTDMDTGIVHTIQCTSANVSDTKVCETLLHGEEKFVGGDKGYASKKRKQTMRKLGIKYGILDKATRKKKLSHSQKKRNHKFQSIKAKVELPFRIFKKRWGNKKVRYRGLKKNTSWVKIGFALGNLFLGDRYVSRKLA